MTGKMTAKQFYFFLLVVGSLFQNCANDNPKPAPAVQPESVATTATPKDTTPAATQTGKETESPVGKSVEELRKNKTNRIGSVPVGKDAELNKTLEAPPTKVEKAKENKPGPPAYISKKDAKLQTEPVSNAAKVATLKQYETVYILETKMTDESGKSFDVPQWYKIQDSEGRKGWVQSRFVGLPF